MSPISAARAFGSAPAADRWAPNATNSYRVGVKPATREELSQDPVGRYLAGERFAHFCWSHELWGVVLWGRPGRDDVEALVRSLALELAPPAVPHASVVDARRIEGVDAGAFESLMSYVQAHAATLAVQVTRLAILRPDGMEGALVAGFFEVLPKPYPVNVCASLGEALAWLEATDAATATEAIARLHGDVTALAPIIAALRPLLEAERDGMPIADAAKRLGMSERTLQRRLREAGTSYQDELNAARIDAAKRMLLDSDAPITTIAYDVGCASPQHFSSLFRRLVGVSPSDFRKSR